MGAEAYNQAFTMHGTMMMFLFAVPVLQGLASYLMPKMLGARDLVFPRLSALGYWAYVFGGTILVGGMVIDLAYLRRTIAVLREKLDHHFLDEVEGIGIPTLENLCSYIRRELEPQVPGLCAVAVWRQASGDRCALRW